MTYFSTDPKWLASIAVWASTLEDVREIWLFGSRATGVRRDPLKAHLPDLDLAIVPAGADSQARFDAWMEWEDIWERQIQALVPVEVDVQYCDFDANDRVPGWVRAHGVLVYSRAGGVR